MKTQRHIDRKSSHRLRNCRAFSLARIILLYGLLSGSAHAKTVKWDNNFGSNGVTGSWVTATNWDANAIPGTADDVVLDDTIYTFPAGATVALGGAFVIQSLTFNSTNLVGLNSSTTANPSRMLTLTNTAGFDLITLGSSAASPVTLGLTANTATLTVSVTNNGNFNVNSGKTLEFGSFGRLAGAGVWTLIGGGTLSLSNNTNNYTGGGIVKDGTLKLGVAAVLTDSASLAVGSGGTSAVFDLNGKNETIAALSGDSTGVITNNSGAATSVLTTTFTGTSTFGGVIQDAATGSTGGKVALTLGGGTLTLTGNNTYTGTTLVSAGSLQISNTSNGSATGSGAVSVSTSGTLLGAGYINAGANKIIVDGTLSPGTAGTPVMPGTVHLTSTATTGALTLSSTSTLVFDIISTASKDLVALGSMNFNSLTLDGGTLALNLPNLTKTGIDYTQVYTIFSGVSDLSDGSAFGSVTGYDTTDYVAKFAYNSTTHTYNLSFTEVPEPTTVLGGLLLVGAAGWGQRRRLRSVWHGASRMA